MTLFSRRSYPVLGTMAVLLGGGSAATAATHCNSLRDLRVPASAIGLPTRGAVVETAMDRPAGEGLPATCQLRGAVLAHSQGSPAIRFQLNLPSEWNGKALQFGGGGLDGKLVEGLHDMPGDAPVSTPPLNPLTRGFATFGSDGGHEATDPFDGSFGRNAEARENYAGAAVKRTHDAAIALIRSFYHRVPRRVYFAGGSKGGHEGLVAAQRYGADYDGIIVFYPAKDSVALLFGWGALTHAAYGPAGGALTAAKQQYVHRAILDACDKLDGAVDGIVANTRACAAAISPSALRCVSGTTPSDNCLTGPQVALLEAGQRRLVLPFPMANGVASIGPFPIMDDAPLDHILLSSAGRSATVYDGFVRAIVRNFWTGDPSASIDTLDTDHFRPLILAYSYQSDATSTDLDAFARHGGKLILVQGSDDMLVPPSATTDYYNNLVARYGRRISQVVKYFIQPGYAHGFGAFNLSWDSLAALDTWVETNKFPVDPVATDGNAGTRDRQMPLCEYPAFPRYLAGDLGRAAGFRCSIE